MKRINIRELTNKYVNKDVPLETSISNMMFIGCIMGGAVCLLAEFIIRASWLSTTICAGFMIFFIVTYEIAIRTKKLAVCSKIAILVANIVFFPSIFYASGGVKGGCLPYFVVGVIFSFIIFSGVSCCAIIVFELFYDSFIVYSTYRWPFLVVQGMRSKEYTYLMLLLNLLLASVCTAIIIRILVNHNRKELDKIDYTLCELEDLLTKDPLTKVYNRRYMLEFLERNIDKSYNFGAQLSIVIFDIDYFKSLNDTYGHLVGDEILKNLCTVVCGKIRNTDIFSRYGGEEFIAVFPNVTKEIAYDRAEEIRKVIEDSTLTNKVNKNITISGGVAQYCKGMTVEELIEVADKNLYTAKELGRNIICMSKDDEIATLIKQEKINI